MNINNIISKYTIIVKICAAVAIICFFLPTWTSGDTSVSLFNMATKTGEYGEYVKSLEAAGDIWGALADLFDDTADSGNSNHSSTDMKFFIFLIPAIAIGVITFLKAEKRGAVIANVCLSLLGIILFIYFKSYVEEEMKFSVTMSVGYWLAIIAYIVILAMSVLALVKDQQGNKFGGLFSSQKSNLSQGFENSPKTTYAGVNSYATVPISTDAKYCNYCGTQIATDSVFCNKCGKSQSAPVENVPVNVVVNEPVAVPIVTPAVKESVIAPMVSEPVVTDRQSDNAKFCPNCGSKNRAAAGFCLKCGEKLR